MNIVISNRQSVGYELNLNGLLYATSDSSTISSEDRRCQSSPTTVCSVVLFVYCVSTVVYSSSASKFKMTVPV